MKIHWYDKEDLPEYAQAVLKDHGYDEMVLINVYTGQEKTVLYKKYHNPNDALILDYPSETGSIAGVDK